MLGTLVTQSSGSFLSFVPRDDVGAEGRMGSHEPGLQSPVPVPVPPKPPAINVLFSEQQACHPEDVFFLPAPSRPQIAGSLFK